MNLIHLLHGATFMLEYTEGILISAECLYNYKACNFLKNLEEVKQEDNMKETKN